MQRERSGEEGEEAEGEGEKGKNEMWDERNRGRRWEYVVKVSGCHGNVVLL